MLFNEKISTESSYQRWDPTQLNFFSVSTNLSSKLAEALIFFFNDRYINIYVPAAGAAPAPPPAAAAAGAAMAPPAGTEANLERPVEEKSDTQLLASSSVYHLDLCSYFQRRAFTWVHNFIDVFTIELTNDLQRRDNSATAHFQRKRLNVLATNLI